jgi:hypothetical protein
MAQFARGHRSSVVPVRLQFASGLAACPWRAGASIYKDNDMLADKPTLLLIGIVVWVSILIGVTIAYAEPLHSTIQRDAPTTRFYDSRGHSLGSASTYGNTTRFYDARGNHIGTATTGR